MSKQVDVWISPSKGLEVLPGGFRLFAALAQTFPVQSEDLLLQTRQAGHDDDDDDAS